MPYHDFIVSFTDALPSGVLAIDESGAVSLWNSQAELITSLSRKDLIGTFRHSLPDGVKGLIEEGTGDITMRDSDGEVRHIRKTLHETSLPVGGHSTIVVFTDVTEQIVRQQDVEKMLMEAAETKDLLEEQAAKLAMALAEVDEKNDIIQGQNRKMVNELMMAGRLQKSLLPNIYENVNGVSVSSKYIPSIHIGGDLYDVVDLGQGLTGFIIADVSGHGVAAALVSSMFKMSFHNLASNVASPKILFHMLNQEFNPILAEDYITAFYVLTDRVSGSITFSNAGHPTPLLYKRSTGEVVELDTGGFFLGMFSDGAYEEKTLTHIENGDVLLLYTDCILETENDQGVPFGMERLKKSFLKAINAAHGQEVIEHIEAEVRVYNAQDGFDDDFTLLLLEFWEQAELGTALDENDTGQDTGGFVEF